MVKVIENHPSSPHPVVTQDGEVKPALTLRSRERVNSRDSLLIYSLEERRDQDSKILELRETPLSQSPESL